MKDQPLLKKTGVYLHSDMLKRPHRLFFEPRRPCIRVISASSAVIRAVSRSTISGWVSARLLVSLRSVRRLNKRIWAGFVWLAWLLFPCWRGFLMSSLQSPCRIPSRSPLDVYCINSLRGDDVSSPVGCTFFVPCDYTSFFASLWVGTAEQVFKGNSPFSPAREKSATSETFWETSDIRKLGGRILRIFDKVTCGRYIRHFGTDTRNGVRYLNPWKSSLPVYNYSGWTCDRYTDSLVHGQKDITTNRRSALDLVEALLWHGVCWSLGRQA